jgi:phosphatidylglycerophosphate synthase
MPPTPEEARRALDLAEAEETATRYRPVPGWYYPVLAGLILALFLLNSIEQPQQPVRTLVIIITISLAITVAVLVGRVSFGSSPYRGVRVDGKPLLAGALVAAVLAIAPALLADSIGSWIWAVCGIALSALICGFGVAYWRRHRRG